MDRIRLNASEWMDFRSGEKKCFYLQKLTKFLIIFS